ANVAVLQFPIGAEADFVGVVDLVAMKAIVWSGEELGASFQVSDIPAELQDRADEMRQDLLDVISSHDDDILEKFLGDEEITADDLKKALRKATLANEVVPVLTGSSFKNKGVQPLLDAVVDYLPSPVDLPP